MDKILLTTGGTGGHIFPALAVAEEIRRRNPRADLLFVGSLYGPEQRLAAQAGIPFAGLPVRGFLGRGLRAVGAGAALLVPEGELRDKDLERVLPQMLADSEGRARMSCAALDAARPDAAARVADVLAEVAAGRA